MEIVPAHGWNGLLNELLRRRGTAIFLGASGSGKPTMIRFLLENLLRRPVAVCLVDSDVGQSAFGLPACISARIFRGPADIGRYWARGARGARPPGSPGISGVRAIFFVGTVNPVKNIFRMVRGTERMALFCMRKRAEITLVDTTGLVSGRAGRALKLGKVRLLKPRHVIAIEENGELEHILSALEMDGIRIHRLKPSSLARAAGGKARAGHREEKFRDYFKNSGVLKFLSPVRPVSARGGSPPDPGEVKRGCLVGLDWGEETLGLGVFKASDATGMLVKTPLRPPQARRVDTISFGEVMIEDEGFDYKETVR